MMTQIGIISGEILSLFEDYGDSLTLNQIVSKLDDTRDDILMSLGWLTREGIISKGCINSHDVLIRKNNEFNQKESDLADQFSLVNV